MIQQSRITAKDGTTLSLTTWGEVPLGIVLIHGFADGRYLWNPFAAMLARYGGVLAMDLRGHGDSAWDPAGAYSVDKFVEDAQSIIERYCGEELVLIGHSLGAEVAIRLCAAYGRRVKALVLIDGGPGLVSDGMHQMRGNFSTRPRSYVSRRDYWERLRDWMPLADDSMLDLAAEHALAPSQEGFLLRSDPQLAQMPLPSGDGGVWSILESLHCDSLLVRGEASAVLSRRAAEEMARRIPRLRYETVGVSGHAVMMDNPGDFASILERFVVGLGLAGASGKHVAAAETT